MSFGAAVSGLLSSRAYDRLGCQRSWQHFVIDNTATFRQDIKRLMIENLMLQITADEIGDTQALFGPGGLGLDSVDALQLVVALDKRYGLKIANPDTARRVLQNVASIAEAVAQHLNPSAVPVQPAASQV
jgi:acyl carrier protein